MEKTGERYLPDYDGDWTLEHVHRYLVARELAADKDILDIASGEGYGSAMLAAVGRRVIGVDIATEAVEAAKAKYQAANLDYRLGSATAIPLEDNSVDLVVSFETIEHLSDHSAMMAEIKRVLRPDGLLLMSSPDKHEYSDVPDFHNEYHVRELYRDEFESLLRAHFAHYTLTSQRVLFGSVMGAEAPGRFVTWDKDDPGAPTSGLAQALYLIAVAGDVPVPSLPCGIFKTSVDQSDRVIGLKNQLDDLKTRLAVTESNLAKTESHLKETENNLKEAVGVLHYIEPRYQAAEEKLSAMRRSYSWRATKPFRSIGKRLRTLKRMVSP